MFTRKNRHAFIRLGRLEVFARTSQPGEPKASAMRTSSGVSSDWLVWLPGGHVSLSVTHQG